MRKSLTIWRLWATVGAVCLLGASPALAEGQASAGAPSGQVPGPSAGPGGGARPPSSAISIWDDRVFNVGQPPPPPAQINGRYAGEEPNYNSDTRARALESCAAVKEVDSKSYRECYQREMKRSAASIQDSFDRSQKRLSNPLRDSLGGIPSPLDAPEPRGRESEGGGDEE